MSAGTVAHLHLLLNHFPTIGTVMGLGLLLLAFVRKSDNLKRASLEVFFLIAVVTVPVYVTGVAAQAVIEGSPGVCRQPPSKYIRTGAVSPLYS